MSPYIDIYMVKKIHFHLPSEPLFYIHLHISNNFPVYQQLNSIRSLCNNDTVQYEFVYMGGTVIAEIKTVD